jgi:hypothetical protein
LPATISVDLIADRRGDNNDGTFTTVVSALVADLRGNPAGDGVVVVFSLSQPLPGVTITQNGRTNEPPNCDISSYVASTGQPVNPRPGTALACLQYVRSLEGQIITIAARTIGIGGVILGQRQIRLPLSPPPSATFTESPAATPTPGSPTVTGTVTETRTATETPTRGPTGTASETPAAPIRVAAIGGSARPGSPGHLRFDLADRDGEVHGLSFDILIDAPVFDIFEATDHCRTDSTLISHQLAVNLVFDPFVPIGKRRFRFVLFDFIGDGDAIRPGPIVNCSLPVSASAPLGSSQLILDRVLAGDENGELIPAVLGVNGALFIDPDAPLPTSTSTRTTTPTVTATPTASPSRSATTTSTSTATATASATATNSETPTATETPLPTDTATATPTATSTPTATATPSVSPTPSPTPPLCTGDCDGGDAVSINELIVAVNISLGSSSASACLAVDRDDSGTVTIDELIAAVGNALNGCS